MAGREVLALIPARGGSKGILRKNLQILGGVSLTGLALQCALKAKSITHVALSTDDPEIATVGRTLGADIIHRPQELADDQTQTLPVLRHALEACADRGLHFEALALLEPTSPFRTPGLVDDCLDLLFSEPSGSVVTVTQLERNPFNIFKVEGHRAQRFVRDPLPITWRRQDFDMLKRVNGCVYAARVADIKEGHLVTEPLRVLEMPAECSINIDTPLDLEIARMIAGRMPELLRPLI
jgi:CMP-N,N'-diacetyllegionaminic acid synthase